MKPKHHPNPFKFGDPVEGDYYIPRNNLVHLVTQFLENEINVVLIGPRRFGKTSFVLNLLKEFESKKCACLFVDVFNITSHKDFLHQLLRSIQSQRKGVLQTLKSIAKFLAKIRPNIEGSYDSSGHTSLGLSFGLANDDDVKEMIQDLLTELATLADKVVVVIDEFQKVSEINDQGWLEATLRTYMQQLKNTWFLFTGSRRSIIYDMLNNPARPFYRSCQIIEFPAFGNELTDWVVERFAEIDIKCEKEAVNHLRELVQDTPNYVQMVCFQLAAQGLPQISKKDVEEALETAVRQNSYAYQTLLNTLTPAQQRAVRLIAKEGKDVFSKVLLQKYEIATGAALSSSIKSLKDKGILDEESKARAFVFDDPLFAFWIRITL